MLVLSRKKNETIKISGQIEIQILQVKGGTVKIGINAPNQVRIVRGELDDFSDLDFSDPQSRIPLSEFSIDSTHPSESPQDSPNRMPAANDTISGPPIENPVDPDGSKKNGSQPLSRLLEKFDRKSLFKRQDSRSLSTSGTCSAEDRSGNSGTSEKSQNQIRAKSIHANSPGPIHVREEQGCDDQVGEDRMNYAIRFTPADAIPSRS